MPEYVTFSPQRPTFLFTVDENIIGAPKMQNDSWFKILVFSIAPHKVIAQDQELNKEQ